MSTGPITKFLAFAVAFSATAWDVAQADDPRQMVDLPPMMQDHMLANMRDHLAALDEILRGLAAGKVAEASTIAESRLGLSSLDDHGAAHLAKVIPEDMARIGTGMHKAASRFSLIAKDAELANPEDAQRQVYAALADITAACTACHAAYRIR